MQRGLGVHQSPSRDTPPHVTPVQGRLGLSHDGPASWVYVARCYQRKTQRAPGKAGQSVAPGAIIGAIIRPETGVARSHQPVEADAATVIRPTDEPAVAPAIGQPADEAEVAVTLIGQQTMQHYAAAFEWPAEKQ